MAWLQTLPLGALYVFAGALAAFENIFPPFPSDIIVAFTVFLAARAGAPFYAPAAAVWIGNTLGAMLMYYVGLRYGSLVLLEKLEHYAGKSAGQKLQAMHARYGVFALFLSRFIPGIRAVVPPFAGAMRLPAWQVFVSMFIAGGLWYCFISYLAYEAGENWSTLAGHIGTAARVIGFVAIGIAVVGGVIWYFRRLRQSSVDVDVS